MTRVLDKLASIARGMLEGSGSSESQFRYNQDGLSSAHNCDFMHDLKFQEAYQRGALAAGKDSQWHWRVHVGIWASGHAKLLAGDFVECGVWRGCMSTIIMQYHDWNSLDKRFFLLDTFTGPVDKYISEAEKANGYTEANMAIEDCYDDVARNFAGFERIEIIRGVIPETLAEVETEEVAFLHLDLNCAPPEIAAIEHFWPLLVSGAVVLLDDYAYLGYETQKAAMDRFATGVGVEVLSLPTGQGLILKP